MNSSSALLSGCWAAMRTSPPGCLLRCAPFHFRVGFCGHRTLPQIAALNRTSPRVSAEPRDLRSVLIRI